MLLQARRQPGHDGSVSFMFKHCGQMLFAPAPRKMPSWRPRLRLVRKMSSPMTEVHRGAHRPADLSTVRAALEPRSLPELAEVTMRPDATQSSRDDGAKMQKLLDALEGLDDVQAVYSNVVIA